MAGSPSTPTPTLDAYNIQAAPTQRSIDSMATKLVVVCTGDESNKFDRKYYNDVHVPLAVGKWKEFGCSGAEVFYPVGSKSGWLSIGVYHFDTKEDVDRAFKSTATAEVMADVPNFTDTQAVIKSFFDAF